MTVAKLAKLWKKSTVKDIETTTYHLPDDDAQMATFVEKYDKVQKQLETVAAMDDLLSGNVCVCVCVCACVCVCVRVCVRACVCVTFQVKTSLVRT